MSCHGVLPLAHTLDTPGPMCRTVADAVDLHLLLQGSDPDDPATWHIAADDPRPALDRGVAGMRLARMPEQERDGVAPEVLAAYDASLDTLSDLGASVVDVELPRRFGPMGALTGKIIAAEGHAWVGEYVDDDSLPVDDDIRPRIRPGRDMPAREYIEAQLERTRIKREFDTALAGVDALLTPATCTAAPMVADIDQSTTAARFTRPVNLIDACALVLPNGRTASGLPNLVAGRLPGLRGSRGASHRSGVSERDRLACGRSAGTRCRDVVRQRCIGTMACIVRDVVRSRRRRRFGMVSSRNSTTAARRPADRVRFATVAPRRQAGRLPEPTGAPGRNGDAWTETQRREA